MVVSLNMRAGPSPRGYWPGSPSIRPQSRGREAGFRVLRRAEPEGARTDGDLPPNAAKPIGKGDDLIYVGKPKGAKEVDDKTKFIKDDERLYPGREDVGPLLGAVGGFAGGEVGLKNFANTGDIGIPDAEVREEIKSTTGAAPDVEEDFWPAAPIGKGKDKIYVGKPKGAKEVDDKTKYLKDDERLYPGKEDLGGFLGATGGFAGGEVGLKRFAESGDIDIRDEEDSRGRRQPQSPLVVAFGLGGLAAFGSIILDLPEETGGLPKINTEVLNAGGIDPQVALSVAGGLGALAIGGYALTQAKKMTAKVVENTKKVAVTTIFLVVTAKLAEIVLKN